jgi:hypothetical protein
MRSTDPSSIKATPQTHRPLQDDPRYDEFKRIIEDFSPEKVEKLKITIRKKARRS